MAPMTKGTGRRSAAVLLLAGLLATAACGKAATDEGPDRVAREFATAWTEARCDDAMTLVEDPDKSWKDACTRAFHFGTKCDEVQPGDPLPADCGKGTRIKVRETEVTESSEEGGAASVRVLVSYTQGKSTRESRTLRLRLGESGDSGDSGGWKVTKVG